MGVRPTRQRVAHLAGVATLYGTRDRLRHLVLVTAKLQWSSAAARHRGAGFVDTDAPNGVHGVEFEAHPFKSPMAPTLSSLFAILTSKLTMTI